MNKTKTKTKTTFKKLNCHPKHNTKKYSCYDDNTLIMFKNLWNKKYPTNIIKGNNIVGIWKQLQKKIPTCTDELCWDKEFNIKPKVFAPKSPDKWKTNKNEWLSNFDIENVLNQYKETYHNFDFLGPTPIDFDTKLNGSCVTDELCKLNVADKIKNKINKIGISINLDTHEKGGSHWVSLFVDLKRKFIFYFDSCGEKIPDEIKTLMDRIEEQCKTAGIKMVQYNSVMKHQSGSTECGMYSLYCIINLLESKKSPQYFKTHKIKDSDVEKFRKIYFNE
uniref:Ubiquitin-like protease family profile domain-containing protein n=1 Tax=viral metagenome TaxID=1070528 RepID=A0A6C0EVS7_9ZZZZ